MCLGRKNIDAQRNDYVGSLMIRILMTKDLLIYAIVTLIKVK